MHDLQKLVLDEVERQLVELLVYHYSRWYLWNLSHRNDVDLYLLNYMPVYICVCTSMNDV